MENTNDQAVVDTVETTTNEQPVENVSQETDNTEDSSKGMNDAAMIGRLKRELTKANKTIKELQNQTTEKEPAPVAGSLTREEVVLLSSGVSEAELNQAAKIAAIEGISVTEATKSDLFIAWKDSENKKAQIMKAQMAASSGATNGSARKDFNSKDLSRDEHKALFMQKYSR